MEEHISELFGNGLFSCIYYSDANPAKIESVEIKKEGEKVVEHRECLEFYLRKVSFYKTGSMSLDVRKAVKRQFFVRLRFDSDMKELRYFKRGWRGWFSRPDPNRLAKEIEGFDWAIVNEDLFSELSMAIGYEAVLGSGDIRLKGRIGSTLIFRCDEAEGIFLGMKESMVPVFKRGISDVEGERSMAAVELAFEKKGPLKKIWVH